MGWTPPCFDTPDERKANIAKLRTLSLDAKVLYSTVRIKQFYLMQKGKVYVSFSGGKDSTVLLHLVRAVYPEVPAIYFDTGLEFPEIREFAMSQDNVIVRRPSMSFKKVIETYGYPCIGKNAAHWIDLAQRGQPSGIKQMESASKFGYARFKHLVDAPFRISERCCDVMKKRPAKEYHAETGRCPIIGTRADESQIRMDTWVDQGENRDGAIPSCNPLSIWTEDDIWDYIRTRGLSYSPIYDMGYSRTGCIFCMFGIMSDRDRFLSLKATHPRQWEYCMRSTAGGGSACVKFWTTSGSPRDVSRPTCWNSKLKTKLLQSTGRA